MIGLVLVTHGRLAEEFVHALTHIVGPQEKIETVCIGADDKMDTRRTDIAAAVNRVDQGNGVIILTDMLGGTPSNLTLSFLQEGKVEVVTGVNLPMLMKLAHIRDQQDLREAALALKQSGQKGIAVASEVLKKK